MAAVADVLGRVAIGAPKVRPSRPIPAPTCGSPIAHLRRERREKSTVPTRVAVRLASPLDNRALSTSFGGALTRTPERMAYPSV